jgi:hypothetical protein
MLPFGSSTEFYTWNPQLHIATVDGRLPVEEIAPRTLKMSYIDRMQNFSHIEWTLDNRDGKLTRPEFLSLGLIVRVKIGYINGATPWRAFLINRVQGGLGVWGRQRAAIGSNESTVTFYGRNRNAPGGRTARAWRRTADPPPTKGKKNYPATSDITKHDLLLDHTDRPRLIKAERMSDVVAIIAKRNGFDPAFTIIEETPDCLPGCAIIPDGWSDGQFLLEEAKARGFVFRVSHNKLYWHGPMYMGSDADVVESLTYGGPDILRLNVDCDFQLPIPGKITGVHYDFRTRVVSAQDQNRDQANSVANIADIYTFLDDKDREQSLTRDVVFPVLASNKREAFSKIVNNFISQNLRAFKLVVRTVGNPKLLAGGLLDISGTGSPFADGRWLISEARHDMQGQTYETEVQLKQSPKHLAAGAGKIDVVYTQDQPRDMNENTPRVGMIWVKGPPAVTTSARSNRR